MVFCRRSDGSYVQFTGMSEHDVTAMLAAQGQTCNFITQAAFQAALVRIIQVPDATPSLEDQIIAIWSVITAANLPIPLSAQPVFQQATSPASDAPAL